MSVVQTGYDAVQIPNQSKSNVKGAMTEKPLKTGEEELKPTRERRPRTKEQ